MHLARFPRRRYTEGWTPLHKGEHVLFVHTGGSPALYAYEKVILEGIQ